jgi:hypothetical protein
MYSLTTAFAIVAVFPFVSLYWLWICFRAYRRGEFWPYPAVQISVVMFVLWLLAYSNFAIAVAMATAPPIAIGLIVDRIVAESPSFVMLVVAASIPFGVVALVACMKIPKWRTWTISIVSVAVVVSGFSIAEIFTNRAMCKAAETLGILQFERRNSLWSFKELPEEHGRKPHALAKVSDRRYLWSYYDLNWYEAPSDNPIEMYGRGYWVSCSL